MPNNGQRTAVRAAERQVQAENIVRRLPNYLSEWSEVEAAQYVNDMVTDLDSARRVLVAMARMLVALRDKNWPELDD